MFKETKYILLSFLICFGTQAIAGGDNYLYVISLHNYNLDSTKRTKQWNPKNQTDTCLWRAYTAMCMEDYDTADSILQTIATELDTTNAKFNKQYEILAADFFIKTFDYEKALDYLLRVEQLPVKYKIRVRTQFAIAQIYNQLGHYKEAISYYNKVLKLKYFFGVERHMR